MALYKYSEYLKSSNDAAFEVEHKPGLLRQITEKLARENIDLYYLYATAAEVDKCLIVLSSANNDRAAILLNG